MTDWREFRSAWTPPAVSRWAAQRHSELRNTFREFDGTWGQAEASVTGYQDQTILDRVITATRAVEAGEASMERDSVLFEEREYTFPLATALLQAAAVDGRLSVLDFGGSLGSTYRQHQPLLDRLPDVTWSVVEQPGFVSAGQEQFESERLRFFESPRECWDQTRPNVVVLASSLQYLEKPHHVLRELAESGPRSIVVDRTSISDSSHDQLCIQRVPEAIYPAQYPMWVLSRERVLASLPTGWSVLASYDSGHGSVETDRGLRFTWAGMILQRD